MYKHIIYILEVARIIVKGMETCLIVINHKKKKIIITFFFFYCYLYHILIQIAFCYNINNKFSYMNCIIIN